MSSFRESRILNAHGIKVDSFGSAPHGTNVYFLTHIHTGECKLPLTIPNMLPFLSMLAISRLDWDDLSRVLVFLLQ